MQKQPTYKHYTRGGQIAFHNLTMFFQINKALIKVLLILCLGMTLAITVFLLPLEKMEHGLKFYCASFFDLAGRSHHFQIHYQGRVISRSVSEILNNPYYLHAANESMSALFSSLVLGLCISLGLTALFVLYFVKQGRLQSSNQFVRGGTLAHADDLKKEIIKQKKASDLNIDGFPLIKDAEVQHFLVHGTVGKGKSQLIMKIMDNLRARGDRVIVYDKGCTFTEVYYNQSTDVILNPFDSRCAPWDLWAEAPEDVMLENMAESLIPMHGETDPFWVNAARTVFSSAAATMRHDTNRSLDRLLQLLVTGEMAALEPYLTGTPAATLVSNKIEKTAISIRSVITTYLKSLQSLSGLENKDTPFSIRDYILNPDQTGWLFISSNGEQHKALKPLISMWIAMASLTLLSLPENKDRRIWFICDELPSLHKLPLLGETIAEVRKFGGCFLLGMQSFSQLTKVYGRDGGTEIFDLLNTRAFFASPSHEMAELVSKELGQEEIEDNRESYSYGANSIRDGISLSKNKMTRPIVTYPEIMSLEALECYLRLPGDFPITKLKLNLEVRDKKNLGFIKRELPVDINSKVVTTEAVTEEAGASAQAMIEESHKKPIEFYLE